MTTEQNREAARKQDGKFGEQQRSDAEVALDAEPRAADYYRERYYNTFGTAYESLREQRFAQLEAINASVLSEFPDATRVTFVWDDEEPDSVVLNAVYDANGEVISDDMWDSEAANDGLVKVEFYDYKEARSTLDTNVDDDDGYEMSLTPPQPVTPGELHATKVAGRLLTQYRSMFTRLLDARPDLADSVSRLSPSEIENLHRAAELAAQQHLQDALS